MTTTTATPTARDEAYFNLFTTALEGGINYWASVEDYHIWQDRPADPADEDPGSREDIRGFYALVLESETDTLVTLRIDRSIIAHGLAVAHRKVLSGDIRNGYHVKAIRDLRAGRFDEVDYDADTADCIVQCGLFGKVGYS